VGCGRDRFPAELLTQHYLLLYNCSRTYKGTKKRGNVSCQTKSRKKRMMDFDYSLHIFRSPKFRSVVNEAIEFFTKTPLHGLPPSGQFLGPGVYGLYYVGAYELYARITELNRDACIQPIYVGKAVPPGWRIARAALSETSDLYHRLQEHI